MNETTNYGLIFRDDEDNIWLGMYDNSTIKEFATLSDFDNIYGDLPLEKFIFVEVQELLNGSVRTNNINIFGIGKRPNYETEEIETASVQEMLKEVNFPSDQSDLIFRSFLSELGKTN